MIHVTNSYVSSLCLFTFSQRTFSEATTKAVLKPLFVASSYSSSRSSSFSSSRSSSFSPSLLFSSLLPFPLFFFFALSSSFFSLFSFSPKPQLKTWLLVLPSASLSLIRIQVQLILFKKYLPFISAAPACLPACLPNHKGEEEKKKMSQGGVKLTQTSTNYFTIGLLINPHFSKKNIFSLEKKRKKLKKKSLKLL